MERVLENLQWQKCICYLDDVIIFGSDFLNNLRAVYSKLRSAKLKLKPTKCKFFQRQVSFLGHIATESGRFVILRGLGRFKIGHSQKPAKK